LVDPAERACPPLMFGQFLIYEGKIARG